MLTLAAADTIAAGASAASALTCTLFGMEFNGTVQAYKVLDQRQLAAAPATIYTAPGGNSAHIRSISLTNDTATDRTFQFFRGGTANANAITGLRTLRAGHHTVYEDAQGWRTYGGDGQVKAESVTYVLLQNYAPTGFFAETLDRNYFLETNVASILTTGQVRFQVIWLTYGMKISSISLYSGTTALATGTNQLFGIYDLNRQLLATTVNDGSTAWGANAIKTLALTEPFTVQYSGLYYIAVLVTATTVPTLKGLSITAGQLRAQFPVTSQTTNTAIYTSSLPNPILGLTTGTSGSFWAGVS